MNETSDHNPSGGWLNVLPMIFIGVLGVALWQPAAEPVPSPEQEEKIADLVTRLASPSAGEIDDRLRSFDPFPPDARASRALADALVTCGAAGLDEAQRTRLARQLYGITVIGDDRAASVPAALLGIQQTIGAAGCSPSAMDAVVRAATDVARTDPKPRRDWW